MATFREYSQLDGLGLADLIRKGEVTATDVLDSALKRIDRLNPRVNAVVHRLDDFGRGMIANGLGKGHSTACPFLSRILTGKSRALRTRQAVRHCLGMCPARIARLPVAGVHPAP